MKCHYEILGISFAATSDEVKKAHRKLALEWHPDKNLERADEAKEEFQLIQQAYEILSDPQERAWYDRHRDEILQACHADKHQDNSLDVYQYFNTSCFKGHTDEEKGFYTVYREVFRKIASEDEPFMDESDIEIPDFGLSDSSYEDVVHNFYAYWQSYCTTKTFAWIEQHSLTENRKAGAGRHILRLIEKENKKLRDQHKKQRNEEVRQLVSFVRKRDKRVQAHKKLLEEQNAEKAKKFQEQRKKQMEERQRHLESYQETEWSSMSQYEDHFNAIEANLDTAFGTEDASNAGDSDQELLGLYCAACDKDFRSAKSMQNHENSKRHKENVLLLKHLMQEEEIENSSKLLPENRQVPDVSFYGEAEFDEEDSLNDPVATKRKKKKKKKIIEICHESLSDEDELDINSKLSELTISEEPPSIGVEVQADVDVSTTNMEIINEQKMEKHKKTEICEEPKDLSDNDEFRVNSKLKETISDTPPCKSLPVEIEQENVSHMKTKMANGNVKKQAGKTKATKKTSKPSADVSVSTDVKKPSTSCEKCGIDFHSRNKLFDHLKESGHAVYLGDKSSSSQNCAKVSTKNKRSKR